MTTRDPYEVLGVPRDADRATLKKAYKRRAQQTHPDKTKGGGEEFHKVTSAYKLLSDPAKRKRYDRTGEIDDSAREDKMERVITAVTNLFFSYLDDDEVDAERGDLRAMMIMHVSETGLKFREDAKAERKKITKYKRALARIKRKTEGPNVFALALERRVSRCEQNIEDIEEAIRFNGEAIRFLNEFVYETAIAPPGAEDLRSLFFPRGRP